MVAKFVFREVTPLLTTLMPCLAIYFLGEKMKKLRIFGLTGGIACGKSTLVKKMEEHLSSEFFIIDCDKINHQLSYKGEKGYDLVLKLLRKYNQNVASYVNEHSL